MQRVYQRWVDHQSTILVQDDEHGLGPFFPGYGGDIIPLLFTAFVIIEFFHGHSFPSKRSRVEFRIFPNI